MDKRIKLQVEGMDCASCAQSITRVLEKEGHHEVNVNFVTGEVVFEEVMPDKVEQAVRSINSLGYKVVGELKAGESTPLVHHHATDSQKGIDKKLLLCTVFTAPLLLHMLPGFELLHNPVLQLLLSLPVIYIGITHFGSSAWKSLRSGVPNMDVLIIIGALAAFIYSLAGTLLYYNTAELHKYLFYETGATIITLVLLGNAIEHRSVKQTTTAIHELTKLQVTKAKKLTGVSSDQIIEVNYEEIKTGDLLMVNTGDKIPVDGIVEAGNASVNESMITGESIPVSKTINDTVIGGTLIENGSLRIVAQKVGKETTLAKIIELVKDAQNSRPEIQKLGDKVSSVFVPIVIGISFITFIISYFIAHLAAQQALMSAIAVLVISCPCAMGLATPTAVMVGIGRAAKNGILIKGGNTLEQLASIKTIVFDKTGTLTTGNFNVRKISTFNTSEKEAKSILYSLELHSSHPIAISFVKSFKNDGTLNPLRWKTVEEDKGIGINGTDQEGNLYTAGSFQVVKHFLKDDTHSIYLLKNNQLIATVDMDDEIKPDTQNIIRSLKAIGIKPVMLSGDRKAICQAVAAAIGIEEVYSEQLPKQKLSIIDNLNQSSPTAMVGDGINDAPALARATVGISLSNATQIAIQSSQVILLNGNDLNYILKAISISQHTLKTIKQNLFWAFFYNVIAIPVAAFGLLSPMIGAFSMAFSDVIVIGNSIRLKTKKIFDL